MDMSYSQSGVDAPVAQDAIRPPGTGNVRRQPTTRPRI